jgi:uncharacterized membrane protein
MSETKTGLQENAAAMLSYLFLWLSGIVFLVLEPENKYIRFHAMQSVIVFGAITIIEAVLGWIPIFGIIVSVILSIGTLILWVLLLTKATQGEKYKLPKVGDLAEKFTS